MFKLRNVTIRRNSKSMRFGAIATAPPPEPETLNVRLAKIRLLYRNAVAKSANW